MKKHIFRIFILFVFVLFNCTEDEALLTEETSTNESSVSFPNGITLKSLTKEESPHKEQISQKIEGVLNPKPVLNPIQGNSISSQNENDNYLLNGLTVLENYAKYIEYPNGFHSYTFDVVRETPNGKFENLLLLSAENDQYNAFLVQYDITEEERKQLTNGENIDLEGKVNAYLLSEEQQGQINPLQSNNGVPDPCSGANFSIVLFIDGNYTTVYCANVTFYSQDSSGSESGQEGGSFGIWTSPSGQEYYVYVDDAIYGNGGGNFVNNPFAVAPISAFDEAVEDLEDCMGNGLFSPQLTEEQINFLNDDVELVEEMLGECKQNGGTFEEILKEVSKKRECKKIKELLFSNPEYKTKLQNLASEASTATVEKGIALDVNGNDIPVPDGVGGMANFPENPNKKYWSIAHLHDAQGSTGNGTYSVYSLQDFLFPARTNLLYFKLKINKFVSFLATAKGTYYAFTISNSFKFQQFFEFLNYQFPLTDEQNESLKRIQNICNIYYDGSVYEGIDPIITVENDDNDEMLKQLLKFLEEADMGVTVFKTDANFNDFDLVEYNSEIDDVDINNPCE